MSHTAPASNKPRFSAFRATLVITLVWVGLFAWFIHKGAQGLQ